MGNFFRSVLGAAAALLQSKSVTATTSQQTVLPDNGYDGLSQVTVNPQSHSGTVTISAKYETGNGYDMGANHSKRYVKTSGLMVTPTATKSITANGSNIDVTNYAKANVNVSVSGVTATVINSKAQLVSNITIYDAIVGAYYILGTDYGWGGTGWEFVAEIPIVSAGSFGGCILARATSTTVIFTPYMDNPNRKFDATLTRLNISLS